MADQGSLYVARESDLSALNAHWEAAAAGDPRFVRLQAPFGGGKRALAGELIRTVQGGTEGAVTWRVTCLDQENGLQWLVRMYGSLIANLNQDVLRKGKIEMILNSALPSQPKRVQNWYQGFIESLKQSRTDTEKGSVQLKLPQDNPLIGLVEVTAAIARKVPLVLELQNPQVVYSLLLPQFLEALHGEVKGQGAKLLVLLHDEAPDEVNQSLWPMPLVDLYDRRGDEVFDAIHLEPWGGDEVSKFLDSRGVQSDAACIAEIADGRPGFVAELVDILEDRDMLDADLSEVTLASLVPTDVDESELFVPDSPPDEGERKHAGKGEVPQVAFFAALLGQAFPSGLVADMGGWDRDSVDDLIDALPELFEEVQFAEDLGTWIYKFSRGSWREGVLQQNATDEGQELARRVGLFMERFLVPRGYGFIVKTARVYAEHGVPDRARVMRSLALSNDANDVWGLCYDLVRYFDENDWPDAMLRTIYMNLLDRLVSGGNIQTAEKVMGEVEAFAAERDDKELTAWLRYAGSRLDTRRQDYYRARDRAEEAMGLYRELDNDTKVAEIHNHLGGVELQDGNPDKALEHVEQALEIGQQEGPDDKKVVPPAIFANAEHLRGLVARRSNQLEQAAEHFRKANEIAGQANMGALALDAGLAFGEALLAQRKLEQARDVLQRVRQIAVQLQNQARERSASELLAQAHGGLNEYDEALQLAARTLQLSQQLGFEQVLPIDLYNLGFFHFVKGEQEQQPQEKQQKYSEAMTYFQQSEQRIGQLGKHPVVKELHYFKGLAHLRLNQLDQAKASLETGLQPAREANDLRKVVGSLDILAGIAQQRGDTDEARQHLQEAMQIAKQANMKDARRALKKKLGSL